MLVNRNEIERRLLDIRAISFSDEPAEIAATLKVILSCYEIDDDPLIIGACKAKLNDGISKLQTLGELALARKFTIAS